MKKPLNFFFVLLLTVSATIADSKIIPNHKSTVSSDEYSFISFFEDTSGDYFSFSIYGESWTSGGTFYKTFNGFVDSTNQLDIDDVKYETVFNASSGTSKSLLEVRDSTNAYPIGFFYSSDVVTGDTTLTADMRDGFVKIQDTMNVHNNTNHTVPFTIGQQSVKQTAYPISFDETDNYASGYTPGELAYLVEHDANGYKFELIQDTDRSNILVGFRYKSGLDNNTYTKFIVPNN